MKDFLACVTLRISHRLPIGATLNSGFMVTQRVKLKDGYKCKLYRLPPAIENVVALHTNDFGAIVERVSVGHQAQIGI